MKNKELIIFMPSIEGGGVEKNLFLITNFLARKLKKITLITVSKKFSKNFNSLVKIKTVKSNFWDLRSRYTKYLIALILLIIEILKDRNKVVFAFQANIYCIIICKLFFIKVIVRSNSAPIGWSKNKFKRIVFKIILNLADQVMVNSLDFKSDLKKEFKVNSYCIYNPLNVQEIRQKSEKKSKRYFQSSKKLKIINIGRFTDQKDQITIIKALKKINNLIDYEAIIMGRGILREKLMNCILKLKLSHNVKIFNFQKNPYPAIKQADIFLLSSKYEGLPNVLLESLALNKFIISSNCRTGPREILLNGDGGLLFKVGDYNRLAKHILFYYKNKKQCKKMKLRSIKKLQRFNYDKNLEKYLMLVKKFIK